MSLQHAYCHDLHCVRYHLHSTVSCEEIVERLNSSDRFRATAEYSLEHTNHHERQQQQQQQQQQQPATPAFAHFASNCTVLFRPSQEGAEAVLRHESALAKTKDGLHCSLDSEKVQGGSIAFGVQREGNVDETVTAWKFHMHGRARRRRWRGGRKGLLHLLPFFLVAAVFNLGPPGPRPLSLSACFANSEAKTNP